MSFPQDPLDFEVMISTDGSSFNEDITDYVYTRDEQGGILIERGRADETDTFDSGRCTIEVDNRDLRFTPRNPNSPYYGQIGRNTPIRVSVMTGSTYLYTPGNTSRGTTVDDASLAITGDIDIRVEAELVDWAPIDGVELCGRWGPTAGQFGWILIGYQGGLLFFWSPDGTVANFAQSDDLDFTPYTRRAVRVTLDVNNGASGRTITFYTAESIDGPWEQLGDPVVQSGTTSIFDNDRSVDVGAVSTIAYPDPEGKFYRFELRNGIDGTVVANPDWTAQAAGTTSFADDAGRTWTLFGDAEITNRKIRFTGEIPSWPVQSDTSGNDVSVKLQAAGVLRRYRQGSSPHPVGAAQADPVVQPARLLAAGGRRELHHGHGTACWRPADDAEVPALRPGRHAGLIRAAASDGLHERLREPAVPHPGRPVPVGVALPHHVPPGDGPGDAAHLHAGPVDRHGPGVENHAGQLGDGLHDHRQRRERGERLHAGRGHRRRHLRAVDPAGAASRAERQQRRLAGGLEEA